MCKQAGPLTKMGYSADCMENNKSETRESKQPKKVTNFVLMRNAETYLV